MAYFSGPALIMGRSQWTKPGTVAHGECFWYTTALVDMFTQWPIQGHSYFLPVDLHCSASTKNKYTPTSTRRLQIMNDTVHAPSDHEPGHWEEMSVHSPIAWYLHTQDQSAQEAQVWDGYAWLVRILRRNVSPFTYCMISSYARSKCSRSPSLGWICMIGKDIEKKCQSIYLLHDVFIHKVKVLKKPKFEMDMHDC